MNITHLEIFNMDSFIKSIIGEMTSAILTNFSKTWESREILDATCIAVSTWIVNMGGLNYLDMETLTVYPIEDIMLYPRWYDTPDNSDVQFHPDYSYHVNTASPYSLIEAIRACPSQISSFFNRPSMHDSLKYIEDVYGHDIRNLFMYKTICGVQLAYPLIECISRIRYGKRAKDIDCDRYSGRLENVEVPRDQVLFTTMWNRIMNFINPTFIIRDDNQMETFAFHLVAYFSQTGDAETPVQFQITEMYIESKISEAPD